ncbi:MAG: DNA-binding response regulator [Betaproteobacteria bacterium]|nr:MAG: DNA-binding response regulator [Betaproteobacteria bacterium]
MTRALVADDEPLLRADLKNRLGRLWPELVICAEAADGNAALEAFERERPDIAFLDIRMPGRSGLEVAEAIGERCHIVFVTAYDKYAVEAFERGAHDYVVKPVSDTRLQTMVARLRERSAGPPQQLDALLRDLSAHLSPRREFLRWIKASQGSALKLIPIEQVLFFHADDKYTRVVTAEGESLIRKPIRELTDELDPEQFWQIHRATIVNAQAIAGVTRDSVGRVRVRIKGASDSLEVSRAYVHLFRQM